MFSFTFGDVGSGKSLVQARDVLLLLKRSRRIHKKYKIPNREVWCNFHMNQKIHEQYADILKVWHDPMEMIFTDYPYCKIIRRDFDCVWDEMAVELPADAWKDTHPEIRRFFSQHRKRGIQITGNTQDYMMLDINARRMTTSVFHTRKFWGSRDPSSTLPPVKFIWGFVFKWRIDKQAIRQDGKALVYEDFLPELLWIGRKLVSAYDTREDINAVDIPDLRHIKKQCRVCGKIVIKHA